MEFAIVGAATDLHSEVVRWAMSEAGFRCRIFDTLQGVGSCGESLLLGSDHSSFDGLVSGRLDAIWYRRHYKVRSSIDDRDYENDDFRISERNMLQDNVIDALGRDSKIGWINRPGFARSAECKFNQLLLARQSGLNTPDTLMSSDADKIREFTSKYEHVAVKPFGAYAWRYSDNRSKYAVANKISSARIIGSADAALSNTPAIYQSVVTKKSDLRVVVIGSDIFAYNVSQIDTVDFDSRFAMASADRSTIEPIKLSISVQEKIFSFMYESGIDMASADFALTYDGELVFLDLNPGGAWLFLEERVPSIRLTAAVCNLMVKKAGLEAGLEFPDYGEFRRSEATVEFNKRWHENNNKGLTPTSDRTWIEVA